MNVSMLDNFKSFSLSNHLDFDRLNDTVARFLDTVKVVKTSEVGAGGVRYLNLNYLG